jgi:hypothetical protein
LLLNEIIWVSCQNIFQLVIFSKEGHQTIFGNWFLQYSSLLKVF